VPEPTDAASVPFIPTLMQNRAAIDPLAFITAFLRGDKCEWPWEDDGSAFLEEAARHYMEPLIAWRLSATRATAGWPPAVLQTLEQSLHYHTVREALIQAELTSVLEALSTANVPVLLMKGTALAYTLYPAPAVRRRGDTDLLVRGADGERVASVLRDLGYRFQNNLTGQYITYQAAYHRTDRHGIVHALDVHWKISNRPLFAGMLTWEALDGAAVPVPALGAHARALGIMHAMTLACVHPVAHHGHAPVPELRWIYDIHLLANAMPEADVERWIDLMSTLAIRAVCARGLNLARQHFGTHIPERVERAVNTAAAEPSADYLAAGPWIGDVRLSDLGNTPGFRAKLQFIRAIVLPGPAYMREAYGVSSPVALAPLYVYRLVRGCWRLLWRAAAHV
jgi:hypothetical protein